MFNPLIIKNHSGIVAIFSPHLPPAHGTHHNYQVYQEFPDHMWQVLIPNFQQLHTSRCYPIHQRHSFCVYENNCPTHQCLIHHHYHFHLDSCFLVRVCSFSSVRFVDTCNESHTSSLILLVFMIYFPSLTRSRTWRWWFLWGKCISRSYWFVYICL